MEGTVAGWWAPILAEGGGSSAGGPVRRCIVEAGEAGGAGIDVTFPAGFRLPCMIEERAVGTMLWIAMFLAIALTMVAAGLALIAFGPPIT